MAWTVKCLTVATALALLAPAAAPVRADLGPLEPIADLHRAVRESLGLPEPLIVRLLEQGAPHEHLPVIGFLARELAQPPEVIFDLHRSGVSFLDISLRFGRGPEIFYVPFAADPGPPYGKAWGYYKKTPRARWSSIRLTDVDVVNFVNVRVCHDHYGVGYDRIVAQRRKGKGFADVHRALALETGKHGHAKGVKGKEAGKGGAKGKETAKGGAKGKETGKGKKKGGAPGKGGGKG
ncbi:MAG: hypothetical protein F9K18_14585 [Thermoanaerobaculia bacterium]|nr:MAG: hypothetical protein F9K18_14585 [Thermoanaerobaculia bacterium]